MDTLEAEAIQAHSKAVTLAGELARRDALEGGASEVYASMLAGAERLDLEGRRLDPGALYSALLELGWRQLRELEDGEDEFDASAYRVMQELVPAVRKPAGIELDGAHPSAEYEREIRERYGVPAPTT